MSVEIVLFSSHALLTQKGVNVSGTGTSDTLLQHGVQGWLKPSTSEVNSCQAVLMLLILMLCPVNYIFASGEKQCRHQQGEFLLLPAICSCYDIEGFSKWG